MAKANGSANLSSEYVSFPDDAAFIDGRPLDAFSGGVYRPTDAEVWAISDADAVPDGYAEVPESKTKRHVLRRRAAQLVLSTMPASGVRKTGAEIEFGVMDKAGNYSVIVDEHGAYDPEFANAGVNGPELYTFMGEAAVPPSESYDEAFYNLTTRLGDIAATAANKGRLIAPLGVFGQRYDYEAHGNDHPYVAFIRTFMEERTGFNVAHVFRVLGVQFHKEIDITEHMMATGEAAQPLLPLWAASSFNGNLLHGGIQSVLGDLSEQQRVHFELLGFTAEDLKPGHASWRYILRCIGSSSGGAWPASLPSSFDGALLFANKQLAGGQVPTIDRLTGMHSNLRTRFTLAGSRGTLEDCTPDTYAGLVPKIAAAQEFYGSSISALEEMVATGVDPREKFPNLYSIWRGGSAHRLNINVSKGGMDALVNGIPVHAHFSELARLAYTGGAPDVAIEEMAKSYVSEAAARRVIRSWCHRTGAHLPSMQAFYETGIGVPYMYVRARAEALREQQPHLPENEVIRNCELDMAATFMRQWE